jgi:hypothetical protein
LVLCGQHLQQTLCLDAEIKVVAVAVARHQTNLELTQTAQFIQVQAEQVCLDTAVAAAVARQLARLFLPQQVTAVELVAT